jgi:hypothetical protein
LVAVTMRACSAKFEAAAGATPSEDGDPEMKEAANPTGLVFSKRVFFFGALSAAIFGPIAALF